MKELADILKYCNDPAQTGLILATVVQTEGSSYRRPGARMLILTDGQTVGSISAGCLEQDVVARAETVRQTKTPQLLTYDTSSEEDIVFGAGLGCKGVLQILVEPVAKEFTDFLKSLFESKRSGVVATVFVGCGAGLQVGERVMMDHAEKISGSVKHSHVKDVLAQELIEVAGYGRSKTVRVDVDGGFAEVLVEMIHPPQPLVIFGAGYDAIPLARMAAELGFHVTIVDSRPAYADPKRFPEADAIVVAAPESIADRVVLTDRSAAVIMSHNYLSDLAVFRALLPVKLRYLGLMGPRKRAEKMLGELRDEKFPVTDSVLERIHNPIGLDIGADTPEQIALAILAEIQCVSAQRGGGLLRDKKGPIHA